MNAALGKWRASASRALRELFLRETVLATSGTSSPHAREEIRVLLAAADGRRRAARAQTRPSEAPAALTLLAEAATLMVRASELQRRPPPREADGAPASVQRVLAVLADPRPLAYDELPPHSARALQTEADDVLEWLRGSIDARTPRHVRASRAVRALAAAVVAAVALAGTALWAVAHDRGPRNVALNRPVTDP